MADEESGKRIPFAFLGDIKDRFRAAYGDRGKTAIAYGMNTDFSRVLQNQMVSIPYF
jgi:vesicle-associated membrane protein 7